MQQSILRNNPTIQRAVVRPPNDPSQAVVPMASYSFLARCFHWLTAALVLAAYVLSVGGPEARVFSEADQSALSLHESLGITIFAMTFLRLAYRFWSPPPAAPPMPDWMHRAAGMTSVLLYLCSCSYRCPQSSAVGWKATP